jgi:pimeloyl-ACP methyl ester carboxylesterase
MDVVLVAGLWLRASAWDDVVQALDEMGHRGIPVTLPGQGDDALGATLQDQVDAVLAEVDAAQRPLVVGHSAACTLAWLVADARPEAVAGVALVGGFPVSDGERYADFFEIAGGGMPFPGWEPFEGPDSDDLDEATKAWIADTAIQVPEEVARAVVRLRDERRFDVPMLLVCPEYTSEQARGWVDSGDLPEVARTRRVGYADLHSGHWPMFSRPVELARCLLGGEVAGA